MSVAPFHYLQCFCLLVEPPLLLVKHLFLYNMEIYKVNDVNVLTGLCDFGQGFAIGCIAVVDHLQGVLQCVDLFLCLVDFGIQIIPLPLEFFFLLSCLQEKSKIY